MLNAKQTDWLVCLSNDNYGETMTTVATLHGAGEGNGDGDYDNVYDGGDAGDGEDDGDNNYEDACILICWQHSNHTYACHAKKSNVLVRPKPWT